MKKMFLFLTAVAFIACNSKKENDKTDKKETTSSLNTHGYTVDYSSSFAIGDNKNAETILALWKAFDENQFDRVKDSFADSVELHFYDGGMMMGTRDTIIAGAKQYRGMYTEVKSAVHAIMPLRSTDKNEDWVCVWGTEVHTMNGKTDSIQLQETWRFNKDGKVNLLYQYGAAAMPAK